MKTTSHLIPRYSVSGFTLLEVLIAIVITALIGLGSWQLLNSALRTNDITQRALSELAQVQKTMHFISKDFEQIVPRSIRDEYGDYQAAITTESDFYAVEFTRVGWRNPLQDKRSAVQRVAYEFNDGDVLRHYWDVLDRAQDSEPKTILLLDRVENFELAYLNESDAWVDSWPQDSQSGEEPEDRMSEFATLPKAIRVRLSHPKFGSIERLFDTVSYIENQMIQVGGGPGDQNDQNGQNENNGNDDFNQNPGSDAPGNQGNVGNGNVGDGSVEETAP